jgi:carboxyl-terminal processing protease
VRLTTRAWAFFVVSPAVLLGALWLARRTVTSPGDPDTYWDDDLRREVQAIVEARYVDPVSEEEARRLFHAALQGYVSELDPYSRFFPPEQRTEVDRETQGTFGGVGVRILAVPGGLRVTAVREDGPADRAGIVPGDVIERAGDRSLSGRSLEQMLELIRGEAGTRVDFAVRRGADLRTVTVEREVVPLDTVPSVRTIPGDVPVGYLRIEQFSEATTNDAREAFDRFRREGVGALVLDLRQNLGGVVRSAVDVASFLLPPDTTVCVVRRRQGGDVHTTSRPDGFEPFDVPVVVLVDEGTASASEILAGALQDHGRAVLVGDRTWGKFLVQTLVETRRAGALVRVTTARYETPRGRSAPRDHEGSPAGGLMPDVRVPLADDAQRAALRLAFDRQTGPHWRSLPPEGPEFRDVQLEAALSLLRGGAAPPEPVPARAM